MINNSIDLSSQQNLFNIGIELARQDFMFFCRLLYIPEIFNSSFRDFYHVHILAEICQQMATEIKNENQINYKIEKSAIAIPPNHSKSTICHFLYIAWLLGNNPNLRIISASHGHDLCKQNVRTIIRIMTSSIYQRIFPNIKINGGVEAIFIQGNVGYVKTTTPHARGTGEDADFYIIDDPIDAKQAISSLSARKACIDWFDSVVSKRLRTTFTQTQGKVARCLVIMQRVHHQDLISHIKEKYDNYKIFTLKAEDNEGSIIKINDIHYKRPEKILCKELVSQKEIERIKQQNLNVFFSQYQQEPSMKEFSIIQDDWIKEKYIKYDIIQQIKFENVYLSCDTGYKDKESNDPSALLVFGLYQKQLYLINAINKRLDYPALKKEIMYIYNKYQKLYQYSPFTFLIEDKASGQSLIQEIKKDTKLDTIACKTGSSNKRERLSLASDFIASGNLFIAEYDNNSQEKQNMLEYEYQLLNYPNTTHDDMIDATSQMINWYKSKEKRVATFFVRNLND